MTNWKTIARLSATAIAAIALTSACWLLQQAAQRDRFFIRDFFAKCKEVLFC
jgi:hypothetical protein